MTRDDFKYFYNISVRYNETDGQGSVFYSNHLIYYDIALTEFCKEYDYDYIPEHASGPVDIHAVRAVLNLRKELFFDQKLEIGCRVAKLGRSSVTFELATFEKGKDEVLVDGEIVWVFVEKATHKSTPIPEKFMKLIGSQLKAA